VNLEDYLTERWSSYQLSWMGLALPPFLFAIAFCGFFLLPSSLLFLLVFPLLVAVGGSAWLTLLSTCSNCGRPNGTRGDPIPSRRCKQCGEDLGRPLGDG
jgi:hypothetical protein